MTLWSCTRIIWGIATLLVYQYKIELLQDSNTPVWSFVVLLLLFFVCEIIPIVALLDYSYLNMVGLEQVEIRPRTDDFPSFDPFLDLTSRRPEEEDPMADLLLSSPTTEERYFDDPTNL